MGYIQNLGLQNFNSNVYVNNAGKIDNLDSATKGPKAFTGVDNSGLIQDLDASVFKGGTFALNNAGAITTADIFNKDSDALINNFGKMCHLGTTTNGGDTMIKNADTGFIKDLDVKDYNDVTNIWNKGTICDTTLDAWNNGEINLKNDGFMKDLKANVWSGADISVLNGGHIVNADAMAKDPTSSISFFN